MNNDLVRVVAIIGGVYLVISGHWVIGLILMLVVI
jgi:hypothetical protein